MAQTTGGRPATDDGPSVPSFWDSWATTAGNHPSSAMLRCSAIMHGACTRRVVSLSMGRSAYAARLFWVPRDRMAGFPPHLQRGLKGEAARNLFAPSGSASCAAVRTPGTGSGLKTGRREDIGGKSRHATNDTSRSRVRDDRSTSESGRGLPQSEGLRDGSGYLPGGIHGPAEKLGPGDGTDPKRLAAGCPDSEPGVDGRSVDGGLNQKVRVEMEPGSGGDVPCGSSRRKSWPGGRDRGSQQPSLRSTNSRTFSQARSDRGFRLA